MLLELKKIEKNIGSYKDVKQRIDEREACHLRLGYKPQSGGGYTKAKIEEERKKKMIDNMTQKFGNVTIGIHGQELPKFNDDSNSKEWWKFAQTYTQNPRFESSLYMKEDQKYWAKNDQMKLSDVQEGQGPQDKFKETHVNREYKNNVVNKVQQVTHWQDVNQKSIQFKEGYKKQQKWTEAEKFQRCQLEERLFDKIVKEATEYENMIDKTQKNKEIMLLNKQMKQNSVFKQTADNNTSRVVEMSKLNDLEGTDKNNEKSFNKNNVTQQTN